MGFGFVEQYVNLTSIAKIWSIPSPSQAFKSYCSASLGSLIPLLAKFHVEYLTYIVSKRQLPFRCFVKEYVSMFREYKRHTS